MKNLIVILLLLPFVSIAQIEDWYRVDISRVGYKHNNFSFERPVYFENNNTYDGSGEFESFGLKGGSFEFSVDFYTKHMYFSLDASTILDVGVTLFQFKKKERWWNNNEYAVLNDDIFPVRLAFGTNISKYFGVYVGGQYSLTSLGITSKGGSAQPMSIRMGGNAYGVGGHVVGAYSNFNLRYSYTYDWTSQGGHFKGNRINNEIVLSFGFATVGLFLKYKHSFNMSKAGYLPDNRTKLFKSKYEGADFSWQSSQYAVKSEFSIGIYAVGLFYGISNLATLSVGETEKGVARERQEDKRRRVEYKD